MVDSIIAYLRLGIPFFLLSVVGVVGLKIFLVAKLKRFDLAEALFSFFRLYNMDERSMSSNRRKVAFMKWSNLLNYYVYFIIGLCVLVYFVTRNIR